MTDIVIVNASPVLPDTAVQAILPALQKWDDDYLRPSWGLDRCLYHFLPWGQLPDPNDRSIWPLFLNRHSADDGVLGFHDDLAGQTYGRVFVGDCLRYGVLWTVDLSHEAGETRVDPDIRQMFTLEDGDIVLKEVGDAVEADENAIVVDGTPFSDFTMPDYFSTKGQGRFDYQQKLHAPAPALLTGGYMGIWKRNSGVWTQVTAMHLGGGPSWRAQRFHQSHRRHRLPDLSHLASVAPRP